MRARVRMFWERYPLTAYQSFLKDVVLLIFVAPILLSAFLGRIKRTPRVNRSSCTPERSQ